MSQVYKIVGMYYRKPAPAITDCLVIGQKLYLRAEPDNQFDPNAVMVLAKASEFVPAMSEEGQAVFYDKLSKFGVTQEAFEEAGDMWHIGYIPRDIAPVSLHEALRANELLECYFDPDPAGKPAITVF